MLTWCQKRIEGLGWWCRFGHQGVQVHQGCIRAQEGLRCFPGTARLAGGRSQRLRLKEVRTCGSAVLGWY